MQKYFKTLKIEATVQLCDVQTCISKIMKCYARYSNKKGSTTLKMLFVLFAIVLKICQSDDPFDLNDPLPALNLFGNEGDFGSQVCESSLEMWTKPNFWQDTSEAATKIKELYNPQWAKLKDPPGSMPDSIKLDATRSSANQLDQYNYILKSNGPPYDAEVQLDCQTKYKPSYPDWNPMQLGCNEKQARYEPMNGNEKGMYT